MTEQAIIRAAALGFLARREYAAAELQQRLRQKGFADEVVKTVTIQLQTENLLSDSRFAECFIRSRIQRGYGPLYIAQALRQRGVDDDLLDTSLLEADTDWQQLAAAVFDKRFGKLSSTVRPAERARQMRFLKYRGFSHEHIRYALSQDRSR